jgi:hypothetical protein
MAITMKESKKHVLDYLDRAKRATLDEQDFYREIIDKSEKSDFDEEKIQKLIAGGWDAVCKIMKDCSYPPDSDERKRFLKIGYDQDPNSIKLEKICDTDVRNKTFFLNLIIEHTQRIRSVAMFVERIGPLKGLGARLFSFWVMRTSVQAIHDEAVLMGMDDAVKATRQWCEATDKLADMVLRDWKKIEARLSRLTLSGQFPRSISM